MFISASELQDKEGDVGKNNSGYVCRFVAGRRWIALRLYLHNCDRERHVCESNGGYVCRFVAGRRWNALRPYLHAHRVLPFSSYKEESSSPPVLLNFLQTPVCPARISEEDIALRLIR
ncbi:hypothetical protein J6590_062683 [Homalodisca vitripennis]|nr:hypothetical protein J6590_062683 [Homalodisca vitripennis]